MIGARKIPSQLLMAALGSALYDEPAREPHVTLGEHVSKKQRRKRKHAQALRRRQRQARRKNRR